MKLIDRLFGPKENYVIEITDKKKPEKEITNLSPIFKGIQDNLVGIDKNKKIIAKLDKELKSKKSKNESIAKSNKEKAEKALAVCFATNKGYFNQLGNPEDYAPKQRKMIEKAKKAILSAEKEPIELLDKKVSDLKTSKISRLFGAQKVSRDSRVELLAIAKELEDAKNKVSDQTDPKIAKKIQTLELKLGKALFDLKGLKTANGIKHYLSDTRVVARSFGLEDKAESLYILKYLAQHKLLDETTKTGLRNEIRTIEHTKGRSEVVSVGEF